MSLLSTKKIVTIITLSLSSTITYAGILGSVVKGAAFGGGAAVASEAVHAAVRNSRLDCKFPKNQKEKDQCNAAARTTQTQVNAPANASSGNK